MSLWDHRLFNMEVKVFVNGLPRVVCGLTKATTCQEVVIALAQALGQTGRYTLWEKFKDFQRCMTPSEHILETLERYGEQARDVQLTLILNRPLGSDLSSRRYQPCPPLRRKDPGGGRLQRGSSLLSLHRQSLPPLTEQQAEYVKSPKRKSQSFMEEAWEWLENFGKGKVYKTTSEKDLRRRSEKNNRTALEVSLPFCKDIVARNSNVKSDEVVRTELDYQTSCCIRSQPKARQCWSSGAKIQELTRLMMEDEKQRLTEHILSQKNCLEDLKLQIACVDRQIFYLEEQQTSQKAEEEAKQKLMEEELEQIMFWENELTAEEGHERDLQSHFLEMKDSVMECKAELEKLMDKIQRFNFHGPQTPKSPTHYTNDVESATELNATGELCGRVAPNRKSQPRDDGSLPHALVTPCQIKDRRPTGPTELREWWMRWAQAQKTPKQNKVIHRSELTIYLKSTKV